MRSTSCISTVRSTSCRMAKSGSRRLPSSARRTGAGILLPMFSAVAGPPTSSSMSLIAFSTRSTFHFGNGAMRGAFINISLGSRDLGHRALSTRSLVNPRWDFVESDIFILPLLCRTYELNTLLMWHCPHRSNAPRKSYRKCGFCEASHCTIAPHYRSGYALQSPPRE